MELAVRVVRRTRGEGVVVVHGPRTMTTDLVALLLVRAQCTNCYYVLAICQLVLGGTKEHKMARNRVIEASTFFVCSDECALATCTVIYPGFIDGQCLRPSPSVLSLSTFCLPNKSVASRGRSLGSIPMYDSISLHKS